MVNSGLYHPHQGTITSSLTCRTATTHGLRDTQRTRKGNFLADFHCISTGRGLPGVGSNQWIGQDQPDYLFPSFRPVLKDKHYFHAFAFPNDLFTKNFSEDFLHAVERATGCEIIRTNAEKMKRHCEFDMMELGMTGTSQALTAAQQMMVQRIIGPSSRFWSFANR